MPKSYVGMGFSLCPVCGTKHDEVVLLDKSLRNSIEKDNFMGWALCPEHERLRTEGYIALIEVRNESKGLEEADRTGAIAHIHAGAWPHIFNQPLPDKGIAFVQEGVITQLQYHTQK